MLKMRPIYPATIIPILVYFYVHFVVDTKYLSILHFADIFLGAFFVLFVIWAIYLRSFLLRRSIGLPFREGAKKPNEAAALSISSKIADGLRPRKDHLFIDDYSSWDKFVEKHRWLHEIFNRPITWNATNKFVLGAKVNYRESTGRLFLENPEAISYLASLFLHIDDAVLHDNYDEYCHFMAEYFTLLRRPNRIPVPFSTPEAKGASPLVVEHINNIKKFVEDSDYFGAYCDLLELDKDEAFLTFKDKEKMAITYLICRLGNQVHGAEYLIHSEDIVKARKDLLYRIDAIINSLKFGDSALFLRAVA